MASRISPRRTEMLCVVILFGILFSLITSCESGHAVDTRPHSSSSKIFLVEKWGTARGTVEVDVFEYGGVEYLVVSNTVGGVAIIPVVKQGK